MSLGVCHAALRLIAAYRGCAVEATGPSGTHYFLRQLTDSHAILDIMGKLRAVYPNVLHLERPGLMSMGEQRVLLREQLKKGELEMFSDFFQQISGAELSEQQSNIIEDVLNVIHRGEK